jgi:DNA-directed RNA polymerase specialized sigma24 family protein
MGTPSAQVAIFRRYPELAHALTAALERLSAKCRAAVVLHKCEQLTYSEVSGSVGYMDAHYTSTSQFAMVTTGPVFDKRHITTTFGVKL